MTLKDILTPDELQALLSTEEVSENQDIMYSERMLRLELMALRQQVTRLEETVQALTDRLERLEQRLSPEDRPGDSVSEARVEGAVVTQSPEEQLLTSRMEKFGRRKNRWFSRES